MSSGAEIETEVANETSAYCATVCVYADFDCGLLRKTDSCFISGINFTTEAGSH